MGRQGTRTPRVRVDRRGQRVRAAAVSALLGVLVLVAGCAPGGGQGAATPRSSTTPTATSTPTAAPTPTPMAFPTPDPAIAEPTPEGAVAAGTQFLALYDYAYSTGDAAPLLAMSAEGCEYCTYVGDKVQEMVDGGYASIREPSRVMWSDSAEIREDEWFRVHLRVEQGALFTVSPDGAREQTSDGSIVDMIFAVSWVEGWRVEAVDVVQPGVAQ